MSDDKLYGVVVGHKTGIFTKWSATYNQVNRFSGSCHASFDTLEECVAFMMDKGDYNTSDDITVHGDNGEMSLATYKKHLENKATNSETVAPCEDNSQRIANLGDLSLVDADKFPQVFLKSLETIFQYNEQDIELQVSKMPMEALSVLHKQLCDQIIDAFPRYGGRRIIHRTVKRTIVCDITHMASSLVNKQTRKDLEKIFLEQTREHASTSSQVTAQPTNNIHEQVVELMTIVSKLTQRLQCVENELNYLKARNDISDTSPDTEGDHHDSEESEISGDENTLITQDNVVTDGLVRQEVPASKVVLQSDLTQTSDVAVSVPETNRTAHISRIKSSKSQRATKTTELYVGGTAGNTTIEDVTAELVTFGVQPDSVTVRILQHKEDWKSFVATVPQDKAEMLCDSSTWPEDITVRPFRDNGSKEPKVNQQRTRQSHSSSQHPKHNNQQQRQMGSRQRNNYTRREHRQGKAREHYGRLRYQGMQRTHMPWGFYDERPAERQYERYERIHDDDVYSSWRAYDDEYPPPHANYSGYY